MIKKYTVFFSKERILDVLANEFMWKYERSDIDGEESLVGNGSWTVKFSDNIIISKQDIILISDNLYALAFSKNPDGSINFKQISLIEVNKILGLAENAIPKNEIKVGDIINRNVFPILYFEDIKRDEDLIERKELKDLINLKANLDVDNVFINRHNVFLNNLNKTLTFRHGNNINNEVIFEIQTNGSVSLLNRNNNLNRAFSFDNNGDLINSKLKDYIDNVKNDLNDLNTKKWIPFDKECLFYLGALATRGDEKNDQNAFNLANLDTFSSNPKYGYEKPTGTEIIIKEPGVYEIEATFFRQSNVLYAQMDTTSATGSIIYQSPEPSNSNRSHFWYGSQLTPLNRTHIFTTTVPNASFRILSRSSNVFLMNLTLWKRN